MPKTNTGNGASSTREAGNAAEHGAENHAVSGQRRKLIKASAAAIPTIMTLRSGAAAAMGSTYHCTKHDNSTALLGVDNVVEAVDMEIPHDGWLRIPGKRVTITSPIQDVTFYCVDTGLGPMNLGGYQCFNEADGSEYTGPPPPITLAAINAGDTVGLLAYLDFDEFGNDNTGNPVLFYPIIREVRPAPPGYSPLTGSCLASIHPNLQLIGRG